MNRLNDAFTQNKKWLKAALAATFFWGMLAHGYGFLQSSFSHDSLNEFCGEIFGNHFKYMTGRFVSPVYRSVFRTSLTLPWLIGLLSLFWAGLSVFMVCKIFQIESKGMIFLTAGIFVTNMSVTGTAVTYMHDLDCDMMALLASVTAVYLWKRYRWGWLAGAVLVTVSLGFYQAYITVTIVLAMFVCILELLDGESAARVFARGMKAIGMLLIGGCFYYAAMKTAMAVTGNVMLTGQGVTMDKPLEMLSWEPWVFRYLLKQTYVKWYERLDMVLSPYPGVTSVATNVLLAVGVLILALRILNKKVKLPGKLLCLCLIILLPFAMNLMYVLTVENAHDLMWFAIWLTYLLVLLLAERVVSWLKDMQFKILRDNPQSQKLPSVLCGVLVAVILYGNVQTANALYLKKDMEQDAYLSVMTRVVYRMEDCADYVPGGTPVVFVGLTDQIRNVHPGFESYMAMAGADRSDVLTWHERDRWQAYFSYILSNPAVIAEEPVWDAMQTDSRVKELPSYPAAGCVEMIDGILVVKLS